MRNDIHGYETPAWMKKTKYLYMKTKTNSGWLLYILLLSPMEHKLEYCRYRDQKNNADAGNQLRSIYYVMIFFF